MPPDVTRFAALQLNSQEDVSANLATCERLLREAAVRGVSVALLPENFAYLGPEVGKRAVAEVVGDDDAPIQKALRRWAGQTGLTLIGGGFPEASEDPDRPYNSVVVVTPDGGVSAPYRKVHLFDVELPDGTVVRESDGTSAGEAPAVVTIAGIRVGLSVCYDLRFPELYRALVDEGAAVLVVPAAFTLQTGKDHWRVLLRARAIESQCWVVAAGQWGKRSRGPASFGHSMIVDPWGTVVAEASDRIGLVTAEVDLGYVEQVRHTLPSLRHRRL
jgi:predicted amidohydrolase